MAEDDNRETIHIPKFERFAYFKTCSCSCSEFYAEANTWRELNSDYAAHLNRVLLAVVESMVTFRLASLKRKL